MEGIQVSVEKTGVNSNIAVIKVGGYIDTTTSAELEHSLDSLLKAGMYKIIIDLGNVDYISSAGWGIFISEIKGIREKNGDLKLVRMIPDVYEVFELLEFHYILKAFDTLEEAVRDFERGTAAPSLERAPADQRSAQPPGNFPTAGKSEPAVAERMATSAAGSMHQRLTVEEHVKAVVVSNPEAGTMRLKKLLKTANHGGVNVGYFELRRILKKLRLDTKERRVRFFRQRAAR